MQQHVEDQPAFGHFAPRGAVARLLAITRACSDDWGGRRLAFALRSIGIRMLGAAPLDVATFGARMRLYPARNAAEKNLLFTPQYFDPAERALLAERLPPGATFTFIDIGANVGGYALFAAVRAGPAARILAIEPQREVFDRLIFNIGLNPGFRIKALACCVADQDGEITLFVQNRNLAASSMRVVSMDGAGSKLQVPAKSLRTILMEEGLDRLDVLKLDAEGAEDLILEPFFGAVDARLWPRLMILDHAPQHWAIDLPRLIAGFGYRAVLRSWTNVVYERQ